MNAFATPMLDIQLVTCFVIFYQLVPVCLVFTCHYIRGRYRHGVVGSEQPLFTDPCRPSALQGGEEGRSTLKDDSLPLCHVCASSCKTRSFTADFDKSAGP